MTLRERTCKTRAKPKVVNTVPPTSGSNRGGGSTGGAPPPGDDNDGAVTTTCSALLLLLEGVGVGADAEEVRDVAGRAAGGGELVAMAALGLLGRSWGGMMVVRRGSVATAQLRPQRGGRVRVGTSYSRERTCSDGSR